MDRVSGNTMKMPIPCIHEECLSMKADLMLKVSVAVLKGGKKGPRNQQSHMLTLAGSAFILLSSAVRMADTDCKRKAVQEMSTLIHEDLMGAMTEETALTMLMANPLFKGAGGTH